MFALDDIVLTECSGSSGSTETQSTKSVSTSNDNSNELIVRSTPSPVQGPGNAPVRAGPPALRPAVKENPKPIRSMQNVQNRPVRTVQVTVSTTSSTRTVYSMEENEAWKPFIRNNVPDALPDQPKPTFFSFRSPPTPVPRIALRSLEVQMICKLVIFKLKKSDNTSTIDNIWPENFNGAKAKSTRKS